MNKFLKNKKGFTLIEIMIVVVIVGVLAAIAIPHFSAYKIHALNSAALSDITIIQSAEATLYSDWTVFGGSESAADINAAGGGAPNAGTLISAPLAGGNVAMISCTDVNNQVRALQIALSNRVSLRAGCSNASNDNYTAVAKHMQGNNFYGVDSDVSMIYLRPDGTPGIAMTDADYAGIGPTMGQDDFAAVGAPWVVK